MHCAGRAGIGSIVQSCKMASQSAKSLTHIRSPCHPNVDCLIPVLISVEELAWLLLYNVMGYKYIKDIWSSINLGFVPLCDHTCGQIYGIRTLGWELDFFLTGLPTPSLWISPKNIFFGTFPDGGILALFLCKCGQMMRNPAITYVVGPIFRSLPAQYSNFSHQRAVSPSLRHDKTQPCNRDGISRATILQSCSAGHFMCRAVVEVCGAKHLISCCLWRQSWPFLSNSAVHTIKLNRLPLPQLLWSTNALNLSSVNMVWKTRSEDAIA